METGKSSPLRPWGGGATLGADCIGKAAFAMVKEEERIFQGIVFCPGDPELVALKLRTHNLNVDYNNTYEDEYEKRAAILGEILGEMGEGTRIQGPIAFHYGKHTKIGRNFFGNFNLTIQDDGEVTIGDRCNFGPNVTIVTPIHPMVPEERNALLGPDGKPKRLCYAKPVHIGSDVWLGANVVVCPGVTIGDGCVIGAGAQIAYAVLDKGVVVRPGSMLIGTWEHPVIISKGETV